MLHRLPRELAAGVGRHGLLRPWVTRALVLSAFVAAGSVGGVRYLENFWVYRGFPPPSDPSYVVERGKAEHITVTSAALGGRRVRVLVFLPPGYTDRQERRYGVLYLLHGFPGRPSAFLDTVRLGVLEDELAARGAPDLPILVLPSGPGGLFGQDSDWANSTRPHQAWESFVSHDLVQAIDRRYRSVAAGAARGIGGLSEGGYAALNIAIHHPGEFGVVESWSGYALADKLPSVFGRDPARWRYNSPLLQIASASNQLRRARTFFWFYSGRHDSLRAQNSEFAEALRRLRIRHQYFILPGAHDWRLWREQGHAALLVAARYLSPAR